MLDDDSATGRPDPLTVTAPQPLLRLLAPAVVAAGAPDVVAPITLEMGLSLRSKLSGLNWSRILRYATTSIVALAVSEVTLLLLYGSGLDATLAALFANLTGTLPSYLMSRYWIWPDSPRRRVGRQVVLYWSTSFASMAVTSVATGGITRLAPSGRAAHLVVAGVGFLVVSFFTWVMKFVIYQRVIFPVRAERTVAA